MRLHWAPTLGMVAAMALPTLADDVNFITDGGEWSDSSNYSAVPTEDDRVIVQGLRAIVNGRLEVGGSPVVPEEIYIGADGTLTLHADAGIGSRYANIVVDDGGAIEIGESSSGNFPGENMHLYLNDGSTLRALSSGILTGHPSSVNSYIYIEGTVVFHDAQTAAVRTNDTRHDAQISGSGTIIVQTDEYDTPTYADDIEAVTKFKNLKFHTGDLIVETGNVVLNANHNNNSSEPFPGTSRFIVKEDGLLALYEDNISDHAQVIIEDGGLFAIHGDNTISSLVLGGIEAALGDYLIDSSGQITLNGVAQDWMKAYWKPYSADEETHTLTVIPEPATLAVLGLGGIAALGRRRRRA